MFINKSWNIDEVLKHNLTLKEIKNMQKAAVMVNRQDFFNKLFVPKDLENLNTIKPDDDKKRITDLLKEYQKVIMIYQSGSNNLMYQMQASPIGVVLDKNMRNRALELMSDNTTLHQVVSNMEKNIDNLLSINNEMEIYALSLYVPKLFNMLSKRSNSFKIMSDFIEEFNYMVESLASKYMINYVDITPISKYCARGGIDIHCTRKGHEVLSNIMMESIINNDNNLIHVTEKDFDYDNTGLDGMIKDAIKRQKSYEDALKNKDYDDTILKTFEDKDRESLCKSLIKEHQKEVYEIAKKL